MTNSSRVPVVRFLLLAALVFTTTSCTEHPQTPGEQLAKTYGLDSFGQIDAIRYTFNVAFGPVNLSRSWVWEPKKGQVSFDGKDKSGQPLKVTYLRSQISTQPAVVKDVVDPAFINDQYWLILPFHAYWDSTVKVDDEGTQKLPLGNGSAEHVVMKYPSEAGGYTPGDTWELFVGPDHRIQQMIFHHGGTVKPSEVITSWDDYKKAGPLLVSTDHRGTADGNPFHLFFSDVAAKVAGSDTWVNAQ